MPLHTGVDPVDQLATRISQKFFFGESFKIAGFVCPFYEYDEQDNVIGIGIGDLERFPFFRQKFDRFVGLANNLSELLREKLNLNLQVIMGDVGIVEGKKLDTLLDVEERIISNIGSYQSYLHSKFQRLVGLSISFERVSHLLGVYMVAHPFSDIDTDGQFYRNGEIQIKENLIVFRKVADESKEIRKKGGNPNRAYGFALDYGLAGLALRNNGTDVLIGTDVAGNYRNYLYHAFMDPEDLLVLVPK